MAVSEVCVVGVWDPAYSLSATAYGPDPFEGRVEDGLSDFVDNLHRVLKTCLEPSSCDSYDADGTCAYTAWFGDAHGFGLALRTACLA